MVVEVLTLTQQVAVLKRKTAETALDALWPSNVVDAATSFVWLGESARDRQAWNRHLPLRDHP